MKTDSAKPSARNERSRLYVNVAIVVLFILCFLEVRSFVVHVHETKESGELYLNSRHERPTTSTDIEPWMTFSYINFLFKLPPDYLMTALGLEGEHYPNIQLARYARLYERPLPELLEEVRQAAGWYHAR